MKASARIAKLEEDVARALRMAAAAQRVAYSHALVLEDLAAAFQGAQRVIDTAPLVLDELEDSLTDPLLEAWEKKERAQ